MLRLGVRAVQSLGTLAPTFFVVFYESPFDPTRRAVVDAIEEATHPSAAATFMFWHLGHRWWRGFRDNDFAVSTGVARPLFSDQRHQQRE